MTLTNKTQCNVCSWDNQWRDKNGKCISCWMDEDDRQIEGICH